MIDLDFSFEDRPWERYLAGQTAGTAVSAAQLLALLEGEEESSAEDALNTLEERFLRLDVSDLPRTAGVGEAAVRLRQETALAKKGLPLEDLEENDPLRLYLQELSRMTAVGDEALLAEECAQGREDAMLALTNLGLHRVVELARAYAGYGVLLLDLIQEGSLGLWQAIGRYRGGDYPAWRDYYIQLYMERAVLQQARANGVGRKLREAVEDFRQVDERLLSELGRNPTLEEIAQELHMSPEQAFAVQKVLTNARLLSRIGPGEEESRPEEENQAVEDTALFQSRARVMDLLSGLEETDARILSLRFGLEGGKPLSQAQTGKALRMTPEEVASREQAALKKLRGINNSQ